MLLLLCYDHIDGRVGMWCHKSCFKNVQLVNCECVYKENNLLIAGFFFDILIQFRVEKTFCSHDGNQKIYVKSFFIFTDNS